MLVEYRIRTVLTERVVAGNEVGGHREPDEADGAKLRDSPHPERNARR